MSLLRNQKMHATPQQQQGALLLVALIMVLLMTIVGMSAIRGTNLQESMAGNMRERNITFQSAESGLRSGEGDLNSASEELPIAESVIYWTPAKWMEKGIESKYDVKDVASNPRYFVEDVYVNPATLAGEEGSGVDVEARQSTSLPPQLFRISARGTGITAQSDTVVQSIFKRRQ